MLDFYVVIILDYFSAQQKHMNNIIQLRREPVPCYPFFSLTIVFTAFTNLSSSLVVVYRFGVTLIP